MIIIEIMGGPNDGLIFKAPECMPLCFSLPTEVNSVRAIYLSQCRCHINKNENIRYYFRGYHTVNTHLDNEVKAPDTNKSLNCIKPIKYSLPKSSGEK